MSDTHSPDGTTRIQAPLGPDGARLVLFTAPDTNTLRQHLVETWAHTTLLPGPRHHSIDTAAPDRVRAACVVQDHSQLVRAAQKISRWLDEGHAVRFDVRSGTFLHTHAGTAPRIGLLFPGQAVPYEPDGGAWARQLPFAAARYPDAPSATTGPGRDTSVDQPAIITASLTGLNLLEQLGIQAVAAVGHSLGELGALHWAGAMTEQTLLRTAAVRGQRMQQLGVPGVMANLSCPPETARDFTDGQQAWVACENSPDHTVVAGTTTGMTEICHQAGATGIEMTPLPVSRAFHTPLVAEAAEAFAHDLAALHLSESTQPVYSTVTGDRLGSGTDLKRLLSEQITAPVRFTSAVRAADNSVDLWIEVGPGRALSKLLGRFTTTPVVSTDSTGADLDGLFHTLAALHCSGFQPHPAALDLEPV
ncbi:ACP S-malonyltransferase [Streptomyces flavofungini]|uniref:[acyl-carrier-protein] S-malonyltransferase n=1 Tax=Streptomyces flavofungini TaxID=68200 RepID=A0ABS0XGQ5_9ACTN|nr:ACP S-malonyltransferase [Streptomyces flavofungini]MBJ3812387.1 ACP S-malonyltransferase [Streptomyces flavofungini]GHC88051.1 hypothetical protein GCM10010349_75030 [Streptomyces flavofungini]